MIYDGEWGVAAGLRGTRCSGNATGLGSRIAHTRSRGVVARQPHVLARRTHKIHRFGKWWMCVRRTHAV